ncbi:replication-associated recombination protein A [Thorsellia anophelis]|uniref:Replication-associated recombination protein A n=1 Tax=Thorsellia anophelis DSM 18579 TaxID=1123402 RepID=A0A1H9ZV51_9GAMM|nr:replication-associated recombination protein A [Thorsellia anophelis]SES85245.1 putative ATPase [Thorsellia anophelis DSM 18579]
MQNYTLDLNDNNEFLPLAAKMRPKILDEYLGQSHLLSPEKPLYKAIKAGRLHSMILWGPPGTGKTTLAELIAFYAKAEVIRISAVTSGIKEIRDAINRAELFKQQQVKTLLFVDEVHRFNKSQQDAFLPHIENGTITFIGATTENPSFELNSALLSRARVYLLKSLTTDDIVNLLNSAINNKEKGLGEYKISIAHDLLTLIAELANGDARKALNTLEMMFDMADINDDQQYILTKESLHAAQGARTAMYDNKGDKFYDLISAFHKSVRGSAPDAALYWYARILTAGGDPLYVARRLLAIASEDIGNADPRAMQIAISAWDCFTRVGPSEGERAIAQATLYLACAPKSNAVYTAFAAAIAAASELPDYEVPYHLRNAPTKLLKDLGYGKEYRYPHDEKNAYSIGVKYLPDEIENLRFYYPTDRGLEKKIQDKLNWLQSLEENQQM